MWRRKNHRRSVPDVGNADHCAKTTGEYVSYDRQMTGASSHPNMGVHPLLSNEINECKIGSRVNIAWGNKPRILSGGKLLQK